MSYPSYPALKDSCVEWLSDIPLHWEAKRLKFCVDLINDKSDALPDEMKYVGLENIESKTGRLIINEDSEGANGACNLFKSGDVLLGKLRPYLAKALLAEFEGACTTELLVMRPQLITAKYLLFYILSENFINTVDGTTYGAKMPRTSWDFIGNLPQLIPPPNEQQAIVAFLAHKTAELDELIRLKERQIELLGAKRQALISHAVTRGLDPSVKLRPSGIEWLGEIPAHWETKRLKYIASFIGGGTPSKDNRDFWDGDIPWVSPKDMKMEFISDSEEKITEQGLASSATCLVQSGAVLLVVRSGILRHTVPVAINLIPVTLNQDMKALLLQKAILPEFFAYLVRGKQQALLTEWRKEGATVESIEHEYLANTESPIPPLDEQQEIVSYLKKETTCIDGLSHQIQIQIDYLYDYRQALISAAVTGKIDVRRVSV